MSDDPLHVASEYVDRGFSVFAVPPPQPGAVKGQAGDGKVPAAPWRHWQQRRPTTTELIAMFGRAFMNLAIVTGRISGVVVVDADSAEALRFLTRRLPYTPWQVKTASSFHLYYVCAARPVANRARIDTAAGRLAIDLRGEGGYVIGPGSLHLSGAIYRQAGDWSVPRSDVPVFRAEWFARPTRPPTPGPRIGFKGPLAAFDRRSSRPEGDVLDRARKYLAAIPRPEIGHGSDTATLTAACRLLRGFDLAAPDVESLLWEWCGSRPGWTFEWVARKVGHAQRYGTEPIGGLR